MEGGPCPKSFPWLCDIRLIGKRKWSCSGRQLPGGLLGLQSYARRFLGPRECSLRVLQTETSLLVISSWGLLLSTLQPSYLCRGAAPGRGKSVGCSARSCTLRPSCPTWLAFKGSCPWWGCSTAVCLAVLVGPGNPRQAGTGSGHPATGPRARGAPSPRPPSGGSSHSFLLKPPTRPRTPSRLNVTPHTCSATGHQILLAVEADGTSILFGGWETLL